MEIGENVKIYLPKLFFLFFWTAKKTFIDGKSKEQATYINKADWTWDWRETNQELTKKTEGKRKKQQQQTKQTKK